MQAGHRRHMLWMSTLAVVAVLWAIVAVPGVMANTQHQTVPTMPPPTKSPTVTSPAMPTNPPDYTPTKSVQPSATSGLATLMPPAQTEKAATQTAISVLNSPTSTMDSATAVPSSIAGTASAWATGTVIINPPVPTQLSTDQAEKSTGTFSLAIAGISLVFLVGLAIWSWRRKTRSK